MSIGNSAIAKMTGGAFGRSGPYREYKLKSFHPSEEDAGGTKGVWRDEGSINLKVEYKKFAEGGFREVFMADEEGTGKKYVVKRYMSHM